ncbi:hypothetical protein [Pseudoxanthomonas indica]|uniref:Uncharacterized protein n=1 Tax=Pseudoxanthomonas indica TaxID=428993 RepID=A0A1T5LCQ2_9GAMM|nr:hypothetical protein [Pseudoxanthomonas indica]GGD33298.1 hypothetical protein GCM10007235_01480 [Pseudoxanthomonas indica]SKC73485.1 hypothetical protein SAMN06296058_2276 [Pseudoxanthomonas indica]
MKRNKWRVSARLGIWLIVASTYAAAGTTVVINALDAPYRQLRQPAAGVHASAEDRAMAAAKLAAVYRARSGAPFSALPVGTTLEVRWPDGSRETLRVVDPRSPSGMQVEGAASGKH